MRRAALRVACVVVGTAVAVAMAASGSAVQPPTNGGTPLVLTASQEVRTGVLTGPPGMYGYYGKITGANHSQQGSYRALCAALEAPTTTPGPHPAFTGQTRASEVIGERLTCTIVVLFEDDNASLVMEGVVTRPTGTQLFAASSARVLAVTGGTGTVYQGSLGVAQPTGSHQITISYW